MNRIAKKLKASIVIAALVTASGCSTLGIGEANDFSCANVPEVATCLPASELYELTENTDDIQQGLKSREGSEMQGEVNAKNAGQKTRKVMPTFDQPLGIMRPPQVTRVWVAPWVDESEALHMPGYVFLTTDPGGWEFESGSHQIRQPNLYPLEVDTESTSGKSSFYGEAEKSQSPLESILPFDASSLN